MEKLDLSLLEKNLIKQKSTDSFVTRAPEGITEEFYDKFLRVLKATNPKEVEDIKDSDLIGMLTKMDKIFPSLCFDVFFDNGRFQALENTKSVLTSRRVL